MLSLGLPNGAKREMNECLWKGELRLCRHMRVQNPNIPVLLIFIQMTAQYSSQSPGLLFNMLIGQKMVCSVEENINFE